MGKINEILICKVFVGMQRSMNAKVKEHLQVYNKFQQFIYKVYVFVALLGESSSTSEVQVSSENYATVNFTEETLIVPDYLISAYKRVTFG